MIRFHSDLTMNEVFQAARQLDCRLVRQPNGDIVLTPRGANATHPTAMGNANVVKMERRKAQYIGTHLPTEPDGPEAA